MMKITENIIKPIKVSVIVPVYNVEKYLRRCLNSLIEQTYDFYEIICIDDCSYDNSRSILKEYQAKYPSKLKYMQNEKNIGQGRTRMRGISESEGSYIMFVDSDDYVESDYVERFLKEVQHQEYDLIIAGYTKDIQGKLKKYKVKDDEWTLVYYSVACAKMYRKKFILENGIDFTDCRRGEDIFFTLAAFYFRPKYKIISYCGYYYRLNKASTTKSINYKMNFEKDISDMFSMYVEKFPLNHIDEKQRRMIEYIYATNMINALITYNHGCRPKIMKKKHEFFINDLKKKFPDYRNNPYWFSKMKGRTIKVYCGTGIVMFLHKYSLDKMFFWLISWIG